MQVAEAPQRSLPIVAEGHRGTGSDTRFCRMERVPKQGGIRPSRLSACLQRRRGPRRDGVPTPVTPYWVGGRSRQMASRWV